jgi:hypothetical protein
MFSVSVWSVWTYLSLGAAHLTGVFRASGEAWRLMRELSTIQSSDISFEAGDTNCANPLYTHAHTLAFLNQNRSGCIVGRR